MKTRIFPLFILITSIFLAFGCNRIERTESQFAVCVTPDKRKIGVSDKSKILSINDQNGEIIKTLQKKNKYGAAVCSQENEILAVYADEIVNLETGEKFPRRVAGAKIFGINSENKLVGFNSDKKRINELKDLEIFVEKPNDQTDDLKYFKIAPEKFDANDRNKKSFRYKPAGFTATDEILIFAGGIARTAPPLEEDSFPDIWGFYKINLSDGIVTATKAIDKQDRKISLFDLPLMAVSNDGKLVVSAFSGLDNKILTIFDLETGEKIFEKDLTEDTDKGDFYKISDFISTAFSDNSDKLAVAAAWSKKVSRISETEYAVTIYNIQSGEKTENYVFEEEIISIFDFDNDTILLNFKNGIAKIKHSDGKQVWKTSF